MIYVCILSATLIILFAIIALWKEISNKVDNLPKPEKPIPPERKFVRVSSRYEKGKYFEVFEMGIGSKVTIGSRAYTTLPQNSIVVELENDPVSEIVEKYFKKMDIVFEERLKRIEKRLIEKHSRDRLFIKKDGGYQEVLLEWNDEVPTVHFAGTIYLTLPDKAVIIAEIPNG